MAVAEVQELRALPDEQLASELEDAHQALFNLRFQAATRQLADVSQVRKARRRVARIRTLIWERRIIAEADLDAALQASAGEAASDPQVPGAAAEEGEAGEAETAGERE